MSRLFKYTVCLVGLALILSACSSDPIRLAEEPALFQGLIDGFLAPFKFLYSLYDPKAFMYRSPNMHGWYDFGFLIGIGFWGGGGAVATRSKTTCD